MLVGIVAGLLAFGSAKTFGEPLVDPTIPFEELCKASLRTHPLEVSIRLDPANNLTRSDGYGSVRAFGEIEQVAT
jgi:hypothetical protein